MAKEEKKEEVKEEAPVEKPTPKPKKEESKDNRPVVHTANGPMFVEADGSLSAN
tara:strand:+ start:3835 stop:3996 length:162 start_codon:yes stop_codon:yes gene_type:complete